MHVQQTDELPVSNRVDIVLSTGYGSPEQKQNLLTFNNQQNILEENLIFGAGHAFFFSSQLESNTVEQPPGQSNNSNSFSQQAQQQNDNGSQQNQLTTSSARSTAIEDGGVFTQAQVQRIGENFLPFPQQAKQQQIQMQDLSIKQEQGANVPPQEGVTPTTLNVPENVSSDTSSLQLVKNTQFYPKWLPWSCLVASLVWGGIMTPWVQSIPAERYLRICWRFFMTSFWLIPLVYWESRQEKFKEKYTRANIFNLVHLKKLLITSFGSSLWFTMVFFSYDFTSVSHGVLLASLANYFISLRRTFASGRAKVELEIVGQVMITIGIVMVLADSGTMDTLQSDNRYHFKLTKFLSKPVWQRIILGDCVCLLAGFCISRISAIDQQVKSIFPPYLALFLFCLLATGWMTMWSLFMGAIGFSTTSAQSWLGLFTTQHFWTYLLLSFMCGFGLFISYMYVAKFFEPVVSSSVLLFEPILATILMFILGLQTLPGPFACLGYVFMLPGHFLLILTRYLLQRRKLW